MNMKCECGGTLRATKLDRFDFSPLAGIPVTLLGAPGLRCAKCKRATLDGAVINEAMRELAGQVARRESRLSADHARFLRKYLGLTQQGLAARMGIVRETIADWERGESPISAQHDLMLRAIVVAHLMEQPGAAPKRKEVVEAIGAARVAEPAKGAAPAPFVIHSFRAARAA